MLLDPRPNLELGLAAFSLLPVLFSPLFAENRPELWHRPPSVPPQDQRKLLAEIDRTGRLLPRQGPGRHRVRTLSAAVRVFVLQTLISRSSSGARRARLRSPRSPWSLPRGMHPSKAVRIASAP